MSNMNEKKVIQTLKEFAYQNQNIIYFCMLLGLILYGIRIFSYSIGIDSDVYMQNPSAFVYEWNLKEGRFGETIVQLFLGNLGLNVYGQNVCAVCLLCLSCVLWCYLINEHCTNNKIGLYAFILCYLSSVVWLEIIYFTFMAIACTVGIFLVPVCLIIWELSHKTSNTLLFFTNCFLIAFIVSIYQMLITLYFAGGLILIKMNYEKDQNIKTLNNKIVNFIFLITCSLLLYFIENKICCYFFDIKIDEYITGQLFSASSLNNYLKNLCFLVYSVLIGDTLIPTMIDEYLHLVKPENKGIFELYSFRGNLAIFIAFILYAYNAMKEYLSSKNTNLLLVNIAIILSIFIIGLIGSGNAPDRYLHALPLVSAFWIYCSLKDFSCNGIKLFWAFFCFYCLIHQSIGICNLNSSDIYRYQKEFAFCNTLYTEINNEYQKTNNKSNIPTVLILGKTDILNDKNSVKTAIVGQSATMFGAQLTKIEATLRTVPFMNALGYKMNGVKEEDPRLDYYIKQGKTMPSYPNTGSIKCLNDIVIVKL